MYDRKVLIGYLPRICCFARADARKVVMEQAVIQRETSFHVIDPIIEILGVTGLGLVKVKKIAMLLSLVPRFVATRAFWSNSPLATKDPRSMSQQTTRENRQTLFYWNVLTKAGVLSLWLEQGKTPRLTYVAIPATVEFF